MLSIPFFKISFWILAVQGIIAIKLFATGFNMISAYGEKKRKIILLVKKNRDTFRPETFAIFMQAPCGRLIVQAALSDMEKSNEYKNLLCYKKPLLSMLKENCFPQKTYIYVNEDYIKGQ